VLAPRHSKRDRVARAKLVAFEADVGRQRAAEDQAVLAPVVAQRGRRSSVECPPGE